MKHQEISPHAGPEEIGSVCDFTDLFAGPRAGSDGGAVAENQAPLIKP